MAVLYKKTKFDTVNDEPSMTEQEHADSCDINKMLRQSARGMQVRGGGSVKYGYDDMSMDAVTFRIQKEQLERDLSEHFGENVELDPDISDALHDFAPDVAKKFKVKRKARENAPQSSKNDDPKGAPREGTPEEKAPSAPSSPSSQASSQSPAGQDRQGPS